MNLTAERRRELREWLDMLEGYQPGPSHTRDSFRLALDDLDTLEAALVEVEDICERPLPRDRTLMDELAAILRVVDRALGEGEKGR